MLERRVAVCPDHGQILGEDLTQLMRTDRAQLLRDRPAPFLESSGSEIVLRAQRANLAEVFSVPQQFPEAGFRSCDTPAGLRSGRFALPEDHGECAVGHQSVLRPVRPPQQAWGERKERQSGAQSSHGSFSIAVFCPQLFTRKSIAVWAITRPGPAGSPNSSASPASNSPISARHLMSLGGG